MNKIKDSFSKIKASDEFKDKLLKELQAKPIKLTVHRKKLYYKSYISVASILFMLIGIISFKLIIHTSEKVTTGLDNIAYAPETESSIDKGSTNEHKESTTEHNSSTTENNSSKSNANVSPKLVEPEILSDTSENNILEKTDKSTISEKSEVTINKNTEPEKVVSDNSPNADNIVNSTNRIMSSINGDTDTNESIYLNTTATSVYIPKVQLPKTNALKTSKMLPLIVYKGNVYLYMQLETSAKDTINLLGRRLGTTKYNPNDWSKQSDYSNEFASNIGITDVYAVNGYDENFRIMTNIVTNDGTSHPEFYECLNGITIRTGADIVEKLKLQDNIDKAKFQSFSDWNNGTGHFYTINNLNLVNSFLDQLNIATPYLPEDIETSLNDYRNDDECKVISLDLKDGFKNITFTILKNGYVYYGYPRVYLKIDSKFSEEFWNNLATMKNN